MSPIQFARAITEGTPLKLFNYGEHQRDFTYIDDIVESIARLTDHPPHSHPSGTANTPTPAAAWPRGACSTSAATTRWS
jgi:UDP-glucuronate 4-epimerase